MLTRSVIASYIAGAALRKQCAVNTFQVDHRQRVQHATITQCVPHKIPAYVASLPGYSEVGKREKTTHLVHQTYMNMSRSGKVGASRQGDVQAASSRGGWEHFAHQQGGFPGKYL